MLTALFNLKSTTLSILIAGLGLIGSASATSAPVHDGDDHGGSSETAKKDFAGDPYMLKVDGVSGKALGPLANQVITKHHGREFRFASKETAAKFAADPAKYIPAIDKKMIAQQTPFYPLTTCVVSGDELGGEMGDVIDVILKNRLVRICCKGCNKALKKDPAGVIAKIDKAVIRAQAKSYKLKTCVISGGKLGAMGDPIDLVLGNRLVRICCGGCTKKVAKDPVAVLAKLGDSPAGGKKAAEGHGDGHGDGHGKGKGHGDHGH